MSSIQSSEQKQGPPKSGGDMLVAAFITNGMVDAALVTDAFGMSRTQLAETAGLSRMVFSRSTRINAPKTQARMRDMLEIVGRVSEWAGGGQQAMAWYRAQPLAAFGGRTAESLVKTGHAAALRDYLDFIALGGFA